METKPKRKPCNPTNPINILQIAGRIRNLRFRNTQISVKVYYAKREIVARCLFGVRPFLVRKLITVNIRGDIWFDYRAIFDLVRSQIGDIAREVTPA